MLYSHTFRWVRMWSFQISGGRESAVSWGELSSIKNMQLICSQNLSSRATSLWSVMYLYVKLKSPLPLYIIFPWISIWSYFHSLLLHFITALLQEFKVFRWKSCVAPGDNVFLGQAFCSAKGKGKCKQLPSTLNDRFNNSLSPFSPHPEYGLYPCLFTRGLYPSSLPFSYINTWSFNEHRQRRMLSNNT